MSETLFAVLRDEDPEDIAKRRLEVILSYDLFGRAFNSEKKLDIIDTKRANRMGLVAWLKMMLKRGYKEHWIAKILFIYDFLGYPAIKDTSSWSFHSIITKIASATAIDYSSVLASPLAYSILFNLNPFTLTQMVIAVDGVAGVGKTSLVYSSVEAILQMLGLSEKDAHELFLAMYIQRMEDLVALMKLVEGRDLRLPIMVFDDAAVTLSAYIWFSESRKKLIELSRALTVSRERIANLVLVGPYSSIFKGLRRLVHMIFSPVTYYDRLPNGRRLVTSLWYVTMQDRLVDMAGTVTPHPLKVDDYVYTLINKVKEKVREEVIEKVGKAIESEGVSEEEVEGGEQELRSRD